MLASGGTTPLKLTLNATDMSQAAITTNGSKPIHYFATSNGVGAPQKVEDTNIQEDGPTGENIYATIGQVTLNKADEGTKYHCQVMYTVTVKVSEDTTDKTEEIKSNVKAGDGKLYLKTISNTGVTVSIKNDQEGTPAESGEVDNISHELNSLISASGGTKFWVTYDFDGQQTDNVEGKIEAAFEIVNTTADQNYLANKEITVTLTPDSGSGALKCDIVEGE